MKRLLIAILLLIPGTATLLHGQGKSTIETPYVTRNTWSGTLLSYSCRAYFPQGTSTWTTAGTTLTNIVDSANTATATFAAAHGLYVGSRISVTAPAAAPNLTGTYTVATVPATTTLTVTTASVPDATYSTTLTITTAWPRTTAAVWIITRYRYDGSDNLIGAYAANEGAATACDDGANY